MSILFKILWFNFSGCTQAKELSDYLAKKGVCSQCIIYQFYKLDDFRKYKEEKLVKKVNDVEQEIRESNIISEFAPTHAVIHVGQVSARYPIADMDIVTSTISKALKRNTECKVFISEQLPKPKSVKRSERYNRDVYYEYNSERRRIIDRSPHIINVRGRQISFLTGHESPIVWHDDHWASNKCANENLYEAEEKEGKKGKERQLNDTGNDLMFKHMVDKVHGRCPSKKHVKIKATASFKMLDYKGCPNMPAQFKAFVDKYFMDYHYLYTDGSKQIDKAAAAVYEFNNSNSFKRVTTCRLENDASSFQAERKAIELAVKSLRKYGPYEKAVIFSDSQAVIEHILDPVCRDPSIKEIQKMIKKLEKDSFIHFCWVPGHSEIIGNEQADKFARSALIYQHVNEVNEEILSEAC